MSAVLQLYGKNKPNESLIEILQRRGLASHKKYLRDNSYGVRLNRWGDSRKGVVYLIYFGFENIYKVGFGKDAKQRLADIDSTLSPFEMSIVHTIRTDDVYVIESSLHQYFADKWMRGEWFRFSDEDLSLIKSLKAIYVHDPEATKHITIAA